MLGKLIIIIIIIIILQIKTIVHIKGETLILSLNFFCRAGAKEVNNKGKA